MAMFAPWPLFAVTLGLKIKKDRISTTKYVVQAQQKPGAEMDRGKGNDTTR